MNVWIITIEYKKKLLEIVSVAENDAKARSKVEKNYQGCIIKSIAETKKVK